MTWVKTSNKIYKKSGLKKPVFLWNDLGRKRVFIDIPKGVTVDIQYSYDDLKKTEEDNAYVSWHAYEAGRLESDFAFEIIGATALRLNIKHKVNADVGVVKLDIYQQNEVKEM